MKYISTRGNAPALNFSDVLLTGLAPDGGLYVPDSWPRYSAQEIRDMRGLSYTDLAHRLMQPLIGDAIAPQDLAALINRAYSRFDHRAIAPLKQLDTQLWLMELFHGPTLAFKDFAMQLLGELFDYELARRDKRVTIVGATSGDTGSAAIEAFHHSQNAQVFILYPHNRVSEIQRRQMTTVDASHIHAVAIEGNFDDCQNMVKAMFADNAMRDELNLSAVNSINWARVCAQTVYYFYAALSLGTPERKISFAVPTGNFGNIYAGYCAKKMGLPIDKLIIGSNRNDILTRFFTTGNMQTNEVVPTLSPSMDIQVSSNFERLLFELYNRDATTTGQLMDKLKTQGVFAVKELHHDTFQRSFDAQSFDDQQTTDWIRTIHEETGEVLDPHTVIGVAAAKAVVDDNTTVCLGTAHPAKFPQAMQQAIGSASPLPDKVDDILTLDEHTAVLPNQLNRVTEFIRQNV